MKGVRTMEMSSQMAAISTGIQVIDRNPFFVPPRARRALPQKFRRRAAAVGHQAVPLEGFGGPFVPNAAVTGPLVPSPKRY